MLRSFLPSCGPRISSLLRSSRRYFALSGTSQNPPPTKRWGDTLLLPKTGFPLYNDPSKDPTIRAKTTERLYQWQWENARGPLFVFLDGPPYANGDLHMGHALNKILKDIINRYHVSLGHRVHYRPGWDCHGLPIENKVLKKLGVEVNELTPSQVRSEAEKLARNEVTSQMAQFRQCGIMANWSPDTTYRTLDAGYELRQLEIFKAMVEKGLIYRQHRPVYYSPSSRSALAEAELVYNESHVSHSVYVSFQLDLSRNESMSEPLRTVIAGKEHVALLVWTTTPWTLTANMAIAVNADMFYHLASVRDGDGRDSVIVYAADREDALKQMSGLFPDALIVIGKITGSDLVGSSYRPIFASLHPSPSSLSSLPIISSSHVRPDSGTGIVHCAPAHGAEDYTIMQALGLVATSTTSSASTSQDLVCHVNGLGQFTEDVADAVGKDATSELIGKDILTEGGRAIVSLLTKLGALKKVQRFKHRYPYDWKTDKPVITLATSQWFANLDGIKDNAIAALQHVSFVPAISRNRLEAFVRSRSEWCISRQRVWGVPIPALYHLGTHSAVLDSDSLAHILTVLRAYGPQYWWDGPASAFVPPSRREGMSDAQLDELWKKGTDTMDVWFDSGTSWSQLEELYASKEGGAGQEGKAIQRTFGADVCLEGTDQHRGWFQSLLLTALGSSTDAKRARTAPYSTLVTHGMVLDERGKKMSKSLGNIVSPMTVINGNMDRGEKAYGAEVLRLWVATVEFGKDMTVGPTVLQQCAETMRRIRNSSRFILGSLGDTPFENKVERTELGLADRYVLHRLYRLDRIARAGYEAYNYPQVINELSYFANITLSSFYFDINKDCLYADREDGLERRRVLTVLDQVLTTMTKVLAPVLPHLAEEIHATLHGPESSSIFTIPWKPLPDDFVDAQAEADVDRLFRIRIKVNSLLEDARKDGVVKSSLSADVAMSISSASTSQIIDLLGREEHTLKSLLGVSGVSLSDWTADATAPVWDYTDTLEIEGTEIQVSVRPAALEKCPRCWTYTRREDDELCERCTDVVRP